MTSKRNQGGLWDVELEDAEFEEVLEDWIADAANRTATSVLSAKRKALFEKYAPRFKAGQRVRVGNVCFEVSMNERDSYEVASSSAKGMRKLRAVGSDAAEGD